MHRFEPLTRACRQAGLAAALLTLVSCLPYSPAPPPPDADAAATPRLLEGLGDQKHPIATTSSLAQQYFDQGLILTFGFNHETKQSIGCSR